eukprot:TRINITY_DN1848_c0_g1_i1.p1 TRINITY_DN1848_c0_g1~~TRINITY_DN1848_c0_g1_i1.p1  ORF type:complete len:579 (-),score=112.60 TRINITY_DN1848_c0_g1_i1:34-1770(-)
MTDTASKKTKTDSPIVQLIKRERPNHNDYSALQKLRLSYEPPLPPIFRAKVDLPLPSVRVEHPEHVDEKVKGLFPHSHGLPSVHFEPNTEFVSGKPLKVGILFSGGQAAGGHNVVAGLYRYLKLRNSGSQLFGFLGGPIGVIKGKYTQITEETIKDYINLGGFNMIDTGRDKIEKDEHFVSSRKVCEELDLDGLVIAGGDDSNTNAAVLAEYFLSHKVKTKVIGVPKTIDGDLKNEFIEISFGFDSAVKVFSTLIGNVATDLLSAKKYYHFIRLMGRSASHITLECALQTHPNVCIIGEEVAHKKQTLKEITHHVSDVIIKRATAGKDYGVVLLPEGLIEFIPEVHELLGEINEILANNPSVNHKEIVDHLSPACRGLFDFLPHKIREELMLERDPHGNVQVSKIETERLLIQTVSEDLAKRARSGDYHGKFAPLSHFFGYEGRSCLPSNFDCNYCYTLGHVAGALIESGQTGLVAVVKNLTGPVDKWLPAGFPVTMMIHMERRKGKDTPVIEKALVKLDGKPFKTFLNNRNAWSMEDHFRNPGPIQFEGPVAEEFNFTIQLEHGIDIPNLSDSKHHS